MPLHTQKTHTPQQHQQKLFSETDHVEHDKTLIRMTLIFTNALSLVFFGNRYVHWIFRFISAINLYQWNYISLGSNVINWICRNRNWWHTKKNWIRTRCSKYMSLFIIICHNIVVMLLITMHMDMIRSGVCSIFFGKPQIKQSKSITSQFGWMTGGLCEFIKFTWIIKFHTPIDRFILSFLHFGAICDLFLMMAHNLSQLLLSRFHSIFKWSFHCHYCFILCWKLLSY